MTQLSVVVGSNAPWPEAQMTLDSVYEQARALQVEVLFVSGADASKPGSFAGRYPDALWFHVPDTSVHDLRARGIALAKGDVIAWTEDHVRVAPDWCERILAAHAENPAALVIGGTVENGCPGSLRDWAHHYVVFGPAVAPLGPGGRPQSGAANLSIKRALLPSLPDTNLLEMFWVRELVGKGVPMAVDARIRVEHHQSMALHRLCGYHFHNGRTMAGYRHDRLPPLARWVRAAASAILPGYVIVLRGVQVWSKSLHRARFVAALPWMLCMTSSQALGEAIGHVLGAGRSPNALK